MSGPAIVSRGAAEPGQPFLEAECVGGPLDGLWCAIPMRPALLPAGHRWAPAAAWHHESHAACSPAVCAPVRHTYRYDGASVYVRPEWLSPGPDGRRTHVTRDGVWRYCGCLPVEPAVR